MKVRRSRSRVIVGQQVPSHPFCFRCIRVNDINLFVVNDISQNNAFGVRVLLNVLWFYLVLNRKQINQLTGCSHTRPEGTLSRLSAIATRMILNKPIILQEIDDLNGVSVCEEHGFISGRVPRERLFLSRGEFTAGIEN